MATLRSSSFTHRPKKREQKQCNKNEKQVETKIGAREKKSSKVAVQYNSRSSSFTHRPKKREKKQ